MSCYFCDGSRIESIHDFPHHGFPNKTIGTMTLMRHYDGEPMVKVELDTDVTLDIIDIPTCVMTDVGGDFENSFQCSNCMNEFDMPDYDRYPYKRCPECGAVVLNAD